MTEGYISTVLFLVIICACNKHALSLSKSDFYSLVGGEVVMTFLEEDDDIESVPPLDPPFFFFGSNYSDIFVSYVLHVTLFPSKETV